MIRGHRGYRNVGMVSLGAVVDNAASLEAVPTADGTGSHGGPTSGAVDNPTGR